MTKNTIIRVDDNNLIILEIDTENHSGRGGVLDADGVLYPFSTVVSPTHSSVVRFEDTNVVLIKLDTDTHDSSAIIIDEVNGQVYPIGEGPDPADNYQLMYQGNYCTNSTATTIVTLITKPITLNPGQTVTITPDDNYQVYPINAYGNSNDTPGYSLYSGNENILRIYMYTPDDIYTPSQRTIWNSVQPAPLLVSERPGWQTDLVYTNTLNKTLSFKALPFMVHKSDISDITPEEAIQHVTIEVS